MKKLQLPPAALPVCWAAAPLCSPTLSQEHIIFEDAQLLVLNKPPGLPTHRATPLQSGAFVTDFLHTYLPHYQDQADGRAGIVHRLDRDTSGLLVCAKQEKIKQRLQTFFKQHQVKKQYLALVHGTLYHHFELKHHLKRHPVKRMQRMVVAAEELATYREKGTPLPSRFKQAVTLVKPEEPFSKTTLVRLFPRTGRTHQLRVQLSHYGYPIVGDRYYSRFRSQTPLFLLAHKIAFPHPLTLAPLHFEVPLPAFFADQLQREREKNPLSPPARATSL